MESDISKTRDAILRFADAHLAPYRIKTKPGSDSEELIPELCPFCHGGENHQDKETFALSVEKGVYVCKRGSCGKRGRFESLAELFGEQSSVPSFSPSKVNDEPTYVLPDTELLPVTEKIYAYFESRKISRETVNAFRLASDKSGMIVFPFYVAGTNVFEKFRRPWKPTEAEKGKKEWRAPGTKPVLFNMDQCSFSQPLVITEGQIDAMSLYEAGIRNVVSVPSGCDDLSWIENCYDWLEKFKNIILFGDNDVPGRKMVRDVSKRLDESRCLIVENYPKRPDGTECKDANEILYFCGEFELIDMVESAKMVPIKGLIDLSTVVPYDPTSVPRIRTMIPALDEAIGGLSDGGLTVFTGRSGDGKSTLGGLLLLNGIEQGYSVCAYSGELPKEKFLEWVDMQAAGSEYIGLKYDPVKGKKVPFISLSVQERISKYYCGKFFLYDNNEIFEEDQAESILRIFTSAVRRYGCKLFLVDNLMTSLSDTEEEISAQRRFVNALKKFATRFGVHVLVVAHPRKTKDGEQIKQDDVSGNKSTINISDSAIVVERPNLRIIKNREDGIQRLIECCYCPDSRRIYQADKGDLNSFSWNKEGITPPSIRADSLPEYAVTMGVTDPF